MYTYLWTERVFGATIKYHIYHLRIRKKIYSFTRYQSNALDYTK
jgi:hypothetical protein